MKSKIYNAYKKLGLLTKLGIFIILTVIILLVTILIDSRSETGGESPDSPGITLEIDEEDDLDDLDSEPGDGSDDNDSEIPPETVTVEYQGLAFTIPAAWHVENTEDGLSIIIVEEGQANILLIGTLASNIELPLEENLAFISVVFSETIPDIERQPTIVSGLPALRHEYTISLDDIYYNIVGFLFPNGDELVYAQFGTPQGEEVNEELLQLVTRMITTLDLPPSQFPPME